MILVAMPVGSLTVLTMAEYPFGSESPYMTRLTPRCSFCPLNHCTPMPCCMRIISLSPGAVGNTSHTCKC
ncbi:hypothetical protein DPMN_028327 [Dreissena polymorpha]|uniref:Secreted protein n=1 Tax=Dreissena polymorpha TaxID=45954 RepID=A0A9D4RF88_DREPO|nr:hypothetical protein DPMN_028327 [Dreissena polymorpha]